MLYFKQHVSECESMMKKQNTAKLDLAEHSTKNSGGMQPER